MNDTNNVKKIACSDYNDINNIRYSKLSYAKLMEGMHNILGGQIMVKQDLLTVNP